MSFVSRFVDKAEDAAHAHADAILHPVRTAGAAAHATGSALHYADNIGRPDGPRVSAFGATVTPASMVDPFGNLPGAEWSQMHSRQNHLMATDPVYAKKFDAYLSGFDYLRGAPLPLLAIAVNQKVQKDIHYTSDKQLYHKREYWASPGQTVSSGKGDCEDYAILQYSALRHLGVSDKRLFLASVGSTGKALNHGILLMNIAPDGKKPNYMVLDDGNYNSTLQNGKSPYKLYDAVNNQGFLLDKSSYGFGKDNFFGAQRLGIEVLERLGRVDHINQAAAGKIGNAAHWVMGKHDTKADKWARDKLDNAAGEVYKDARWAKGKISGLFGAVAGRPKEPTAAPKHAPAAPKAKSSPPAIRKITAPTWGPH